MLTWFGKSGDGNILMWAINDRMRGDWSLLSESPGYYTLVLLRCEITEDH